MESIIPVSLQFDEDELLAKLREFWEKDAAATAVYNETGKMGGRGETLFTMTIQNTPVELGIVSDELIAVGFRSVYLACDADDLYEALVGKRTPGVGLFHLGVMIMRGPDAGWMAAQGIVMSNERELFDPWPTELRERLEALHPVYGRS